MEGLKEIHEEDDPSFMKSQQEYIDFLRDPTTLAMVKGRRSAF